MSIGLLQPHMISNIIDDSEITVEVQSDDTLTLFAVITSTKGAANKVMEFYDSTKIIEEYGKPDYRIHGLAYVNVINAVKNGAKALIMRVAPVDDATKPERASGSLANVFLDIQTKEVAAIPASVVELSTASSTLSEDASNSGQSTLVIPNGEFTTSDELSRLKAGDDVFFFEDVTDPTDATDEAVIDIEYYVQGSSFSTVGLSNGLGVTLKFDSGDVTATISSSNGVGGITRFSMLLDNAASDIATTDTVLMIQTVTGDIIGQASMITKVGRVSLADAALVTITNDVDLAAYTGVAGDVFTVSVNGAVGVEVDIEGDTGMVAIAAKFDAVAGLTAAASGNFVQLDNDAVVGPISSITVSAVSSTIFAHLFTTGGTSITIEDVNDFNITNMDYNSTVAIEETVTVLNGEVTAGNLYNVFSGKGKTVSSFYINEIVGGDVLTDFGGTSVEVVVKVVTSATGGIVDNTIDLTKDLNILSFASDPVDQTAEKGMLFFDFKTYGPVMEVRPVALSKKVGTVEELEAFMLNPYSDPLVGTTDDGFKRHIIFGVSKGMSLAENAFGLRFTVNNKYDNDVTGFRIFNVEATETINGVVRVVGSPYVVSFDQDAVDARGDNMNIAAMLGTYDTTFSQQYTSHDEYLTLLDDLSAAATTQGLDIDPGNYDFILDTPRDVFEVTEDEQYYIEIVNTPFSNDETAIDIGGTATYPLYKESLLTTISTSIVDNEVVTTLNCGTTLSQGSSGSLDGTDVNGTVLTAAEKRALVEELTVDGYNGTINDEIFNKTAYPIDVIFDGKYSVDVKTAIVDFITHSSRKDIFFYGDLGDSPNYLTTLNTRKNQLSGIDTFQAGFFGQEYVVYDNNTKTDMKTSLIHAIALRLAEHDKAKGKGPQTPLAGPSFRLSGYKDGSLSFNPNVDQKEEFIKNRINYAEKDTTSTCTMKTQLTSQVKTSELSYINNTRVLLKMIYLAESIARNYQNATYDSIVTNFKKDLEDAMATYTNNQSIQYIKIEVNSTDYEKRRKLAHVYARVKFTDRMESFIFDWTVTV